MSEQRLKPYRVLLVIDGQWRDQHSQIIDADHADAEFVELAGLLRLWGVPFDLLRLDQQTITRTQLLDEKNAPRYGVILWCADTSKFPRSDDEWNTLRFSIEQAGSSLLVLGQYAQDEPIAQLLGVKVKGVGTSSLAPWSPRMTITGTHALVAGLENQTVPASDVKTVDYWKVHRVTATSPATQVLAKHERFAAMTLREIRPACSAIWIGGDWARMLRYAYNTSAQLLRSALTWAIGYTIMCQFDDAVMLTMDDPGVAHYMYAWHCASLSAEMIRSHMIQPLRAHNARLVVFAVPGFLNRDTRQIESTWTQIYVDAFGDKQDLVSTKIGIDEGLAAGVLEVQCHGLTHMQPDLISPPGPWFDAPLDGEASHPDWYFEFWDRRRNSEIPAEIQINRMTQGCQLIEQQFQKRSLCFRPGGFKFSRTHANNTWRAAGNAGFGLALGYTIPYCVARNSVFEISRGSPLILTCHDIDLYQEPNTINNMIQKARTSRGPNVRFLGADEFSSYLHTRLAPTTDSIHVTIDPQLATHAFEHGSTWQIRVAPWLAALRVTVDNQPVTASDMQPKNLQFPAGKSHFSIALSASTGALAT